jgi:AcrR family transcriptional regulator
MSRLGPTQWTLADVARDVGLTAGALVQRFGSKRNLQLALAATLAGSTRQMFAALRAAHRSPLAAVYAYADCFGRMGDSPAALARGFAYLQVDLTDPEFRRHTLAQARASRAEIEALVRAAVRAGELVRRADPRGLARALEVTIGGSMMAWACYQEGPLTSWIRHDLDALLRPVLTSRGRRIAGRPPDGPSPADGAPARQFTVRARPRAGPGPERGS